REVLSVPPGAGEAPRQAVEKATAENMHDQATIARLRSAVAPAARQAGVRAPRRALGDLLLACDAEHLIPHCSGERVRLSEADLPFASDLPEPRRAIEEGVAWGVAAGGPIVSIAWAHRTGVMSDRIAELGVTTAPAHRGRGYAKSAVSAVVEQITARGGEALYACRPDNLPSRAVAQAVGFVPYGRALVLTSPWQLGR
ncbi:MAG: GNAT family N-acetyltransferase, partial [Planctomycetota bacterium]